MLRTEEEPAWDSMAAISRGVIRLEDEDELFCVLTVAIEEELALAVFGATEDEAIAAAELDEAVLTDEVC